MIFNSLKLRLQLWYGLLLVAVLVGLGVAAYRLEYARTFSREDAELQRRAGGVANALRSQGGVRPPRDEQRGEFPPPDDAPMRDDPNGRPEQNIVAGFHLPPQVAAMFDDTDPQGFYYFLIRRNGEELARSANVPSLNRGVLVAAPVAAVAETGQPGEPAENQAPPVPQMFGNFREVKIITPPGEVIVVGHNVAAELAELHGLAVKLVVVGSVILALGLAGGWWLAARAIRPIADITDAAQRISTGDLSQRISTADHTSELGELATTLNTTFARLEASFVQQAQFTSDAAHELRTPVSVILTQAQSTLKKERTVAEYKETLEACERAATRMRRLTESLLQLARLDAGQENFRHEKFDLAATAQNCATLIAPLAAERGLTLHTDCAAASSTGDSERIAQVLTNLLTNAIKYNRDGGEIFVATRAENNSAVLTVRDTGLGISAEDLPRVFERFYRADKSRTNASGSAGLGLAICQAIVNSHGGELTVASELEVGTTFTVRLAP
ncbi:MAG: hypothetical protein RLZZ350_1162 [Verrucomicrobiota bacterium]|jgi:heavy metal sensor kinase